MSIFKPTLFENFEIKGEWWLPQNPEKKVVGTLSFKSGDDITIEVLGSFLGTEYFSSNNDFNPEIVLGLANNGDRLTLLQNTEVRRRSSFGGTGSITYSTDYLFLGAHFSSLDAMRFSSCYINYSNLEEWIGTLPFEDEVVWEGEKFRGKKASYSLSEGFKASVPSLDAIISTWHGLSDKGDDDFRQLLWEHTAYLVITPEEPHNFDWYWKVRFELRNLLSLFIGNPVYPRVVRFTLETEPVGSAEPQRQTVEFYFTQSAQQAKKRIHPTDVLVRLSDIEENISTIIDSWFSKSEKLGDVYELFFGAIYGQGMYDHLHFLTLMQALETYHRRTREGAYVSETDYEKVYNALLVAIPENTSHELKDALTGRMKYGNEYSLRKRVKSLLTELAEDCRKLVTNDPKSFIGSVIDTRNYLTHYDESLKPKELSGADLYNANLRLRILITISLLKELGIEEEKIAGMLSVNRSITRGWVSNVDFDAGGTSEDQT